MEQIVQLDPHPWKCLSVVSPGISCQLASAGMDISVAAIANPAMPIAHAKSSFFTLRSPQKYTQHLLSGTPAFHDHAHVGVRSHAGATSNQSPSLTEFTIVVITNASDTKCIFRQGQQRLVYLRQIFVRRSQGPHQAFAWSH